MKLLLLVTVFCNNEANPIVLCIKDPRALIYTGWLHFSWDWEVGEGGGTLGEG